MPGRCATPTILLPTLGADARLFDPQRAVFGDLAVPAWLPHEPDEALAAYARRLATSITPPADYYLGGVSFGGMVALEMAQHLDPAPRAVVLIASGRSGQCIAPHLHYFVRFADLFPARQFEPGQGLSKLYVEKFGDLTHEQCAFYESMLAAVSVEFVRWGIGAISAWCGPARIDVPVHHIHGRDDQLIPCERVEPDEVVEGAGHLVNLTHAEQVNAFLAATVAGFG